MTSRSQMTSCPLAVMTNNSAQNLLCEMLRFAFLGSCPVSRCVVGHRGWGVVVRGALS